MRAVLPSDVLEPSVVKFDLASSPVVIFAVHDRQNRMSSADLRRNAEDIVKPRLERVDGVASVDVSGGLEREVHVDLDINRLRAHNIPVQSIVNSIKSDNLNLPGGRVIQGQNERLVRTTGEFHSIDEIGLVQIPRSQGAPILLRDLATVNDGYKEARVLSRLNGQDAVTMSVLKQSGTNTVRVADGLKAQLKELQSSRSDLEFTIVSDQSTFTRDSTNDVLLSLIAGAFLAAFVVFFFFRDLRNTLVTVAGLPMIVLGTFAVMKAIGFSFNMVTLMALSLSIGMLIDDAIVVRENIFRHMERGEEPMVAASNGTAEIALAVLATTLSIVCVFAPIAFISGIAGKFFKEFGLVVVIAVLISLFEAFTLAPMLSAHFFKAIAPERRRKENDTGGGVFGRVLIGYRSLLDWSIKHRAVVVGMAILVLVASVLMMRTLSFSFMESSDTGEGTISMEMPAGSSLEQTNTTVKQIERIILNQPEIEYAFAQVGSASGGVDKATIYLKTKRTGQIKPLTARIRPEIAAISGLKFSIDDATGMASMGSGSAGTVRGRPVQVSLQGNNLDDLDKASSMVMSALAKVPGTIDIGRTLTEGKPEAQVKVNRDLAADLGASTAQVAATIRTLVNGETASKFRTPEKDYDIVVRLREEDRRDLPDILLLPVTTSKGGQIPLNTIATITQALGPTQIDRLDRERQIVVGSGFHERALGDVVNDSQKAVAGLKLPAGVTVTYTGQAKYLAEMLSSLVTALLLSILFIYMVLGSQFGSFAQPLVIMLSLPLSIAGVAGALILTQKNLDMMALIGVIMLMGLVTKNAILLVDFINKRRQAGLQRNEAVLLAGPVRLRPILMTTLAMIFGMLPTALGLGSGVEIRVSMAVTVIGGLITSTILTLLVVPVAYTLLDDLLHVFQRRSNPVTQPVIQGVPVIAGSSQNHSDT
jgi:HAE1 family hydrophobic/amphiphilic exporter-1